MLQEEALHVLMVSVGFESTQCLAHSLWRPGHAGRRLQVLVVDLKRDICPISRVMCLELYKPNGRYGFMPMLGFFCS